MDNGEETFASPIAGAAAEFEFDPYGTNGGVGATKSHDADEIDALRAAKRDLEEKLDAVGHQNRILSSESARLEFLVSQARDEIAAAESTAAVNEGEVATLRAEVKRLQDLLDSEKAGREEETRRGAELGDQLQSAYQEKAALMEEIEALKASAAAVAAELGKGEQEDSAAPSDVTPKEVGTPSHGLVAAAAAGAAATAAIAVVLLNLKR